MNIETAYSAKSPVPEAVAELKARLGKPDVKLVLYFVSSHYDAALVAAEMEKAFAPATALGCTTSGEIISGRMLKDSIVAMAFNDQIIRDVKVEVLEDVRQSAALAVSRALTGFEQHYGVKMLEVDHTQYAGIILVDGLSGAEETLMERIGDLTNVPFIGGSAGDDLAFIRTYVMAHGRAYTNAALLALIKPVGEFDFIKTQSFTPHTAVLVPTKVDQGKRAVLEFNHRPAAQAYAAALQTTVEQLPERFMSNPVGLMADNEPYVRSPQRVQGESVVFYCAVSEGMELKVLEAMDIVRGTQKALAEKLAQVGHIQGLINFHCILRTLELEKKNQTEAYGKLFADIPTIGFSTYGEEFIGHINQTSTMLIFK